MFNFDFTKKSQNKSKKRVGLDLGTSAVKLIEVENIGEKPALTKIGIRALPDPSRETLKESIGSLIEELKLSSKEVNISVTGPSTIVRFVSMPKMRDDELKGAIRFEAEKYIPFSLDDCIIDYQVLKKNEKENKFDMLLVAVKKETIMEKIGIIEGVGLDVGLVDVDTFAVTNSFLKNFSNREDPNKAAALVNIGASITNVSIVKGQIPCFSRDVAIGGNDFTAAISKGMNIDRAAAESLKVSAQDKAKDVTVFTKSVLNNLLDEIKLSFSYYENQSGSGIEDIYISGGSSMLSGLEGAFNESFELKPFLWDSLGFLDISKIGESLLLAKTMSRFFAVSSGLVLR